MDTNTTIQQINADLLQYAQDNGIIDISSVLTQIEEMKKNEIIKRHNYKIWQGTDGKWKTYLPDKEKGRRLINKVSKEKLEETIIAYYKEEAENPTVKEIFEEWNDRRLGLKKISPSTHLRTVQFFERHFIKDEDKMANQKIKAISAMEWQDFLEEQVARYDLTAKAFSSLKGIVRGFLKRAKKRELIHFSVDEMLEDLDVSEREFKRVIHEDYEEVYDEDETEKMVTYLKDNLDVHNMAILLMFATGMRIGEIVALKHEDVEDGYIKVRRTETRYKDASGHYVTTIKDYPKTKAGVRNIVIPDETGWIETKLKLLNPFGEYIFIQPKNGERMKAQAVRRRLQQLCTKLKIYQKSPHKIRKTYGTILMDANADDNLLLQQMGHVDRNISERYYHRNRKSIEQKRKILEKIPDLMDITGRKREA